MAKKLTDSQELLLGRMRDGAALDLLRTIPKKVYILEGFGKVNTRDVEVLIHGALIKKKTQAEAGIFEVYESV